ncbi:uroporphyrinogen-III synthase HEM4 KNAG_0G02900 [Huiozyma naganishii CBS 8797]|uniref:Tetrapyrrole biosynthesis uroporphyrinogen III synthase domain-containing protein n=1 Tax=Huiozyma naganishii (strain ATCC MYA-139 / BCRC 22969 / CBS 8797 / KCTC 17520 / NBRC 10181 / NCYC 3082 / Yp74L-3) TaxID=1071383 RepID=J7S187_HUIN7|nr:hypothetical protein KNAG_0G02900 [Kazachstania naganishii CBS 8797]CCK71347.1 hypothetical protein KNAG_0G02900 [Kazachstania naganishii CBS 8797]
MSKAEHVILLKNKTEPVDKYESLAPGFDFHSVDFLPLIRHENVPDELLVLLHDSSSLRNLRHIIVTSQRTVECLYHSVLPYLTPSVKREFLRKKVYTVGPATGNFLRECGFSDVCGDEAGNGGNLADMLLQTLPDYDGEILFLVGVIRRDIIRKKLTAQGLKVRELVTYQTSALEHSLPRFCRCLKTSCTNWVVIFSPQGTDDIVNYLKEVQSQEAGPVLKVACIGPTTEQFLLDNGVKPLVVSTKPEPTYLWESIRQYDNGELH